MFNMSSAMASQFVDAAKEMTETITNLGPNPLSLQKIEHEEQSNSERI
jgi:coenzyme F420-reducing hydrogenase delta subunit